MQDIVDELKQAWWLTFWCPKICKGRWCSFEDFQRWQESFHPERLAGTRYLGMQQGWHIKQKDAFLAMMRHLSPATEQPTFDNEEKESMTTSAKWRPENERSVRTVCATLQWSWNTTTFSSMRERRLGRRDLQSTVTSIGPIFIEDQNRVARWPRRVLQEPSA